MTSIYRFVLCLIVASLSIETVADSATIERLENQVKALQRKINEDSTSVSSYQTKIQKISAELEDAKVKLAETEIALNTATSNHEGDPSVENSRALRRATDMNKLAARKVSSKQKRVDWLENEIKTLRASAATSRKEIDQTNAQITAVKKQWGEEVKKQRAAQNAALQQAQQKPPVVKATPAVKAPTPKPSPVLAALPKELNPASDTSDLKDGSYAGRKINEFNTYLASNVSQDASITLRVGFSDKSGRIRFEHLGGEIYRGEIKLRRGKQVINYDGSSFRINVEKEDDKKPHLIYFDNRSKDKRSIVVIEKSLAKL